MSTKAADVPRCRAGALVGVTSLRRSRKSRALALATHQESDRCSHELTAAIFVSSAISKYEYEY